MSDLLASNFKKQKLFLKTLKIYKKKLNEKKDYLIYRNIGNLFFDLGRINKAIYYFKKSEDLNKIDKSNLWNLSLCYLTLGNFDKGFELYEYRWLKKVNKQIQEVESDEEAEVQVVKKKKRKTKPRIIVEEDSSDSEQEIVISRRRKNKKKEPIVATQSLPIDIPQETAKDETGPMEKEKPVKEVKEKVPELKEYTHLQILKGLGL